VKRSVRVGLRLWCPYAWRLDEEVHRTISQQSHGLTRDIHSRHHGVRIFLRFRSTLEIGSEDFNSYCTAHYGTFRDGSKVLSAQSQIYA
jgi:hypothetical protein